MKISLGWLREFVDIDEDAQALAERLTMGGFEVEGTEDVGAEIAGVVVAEIVTTTAHPSDEQLTICQVRAGEATVQVVSGARNMRAGDRVAYAPPGACLPGARRIDLMQIRGVASEGMLCSAAELDLSDAADGLLLLPSDATLGERVGAALGIEDTILDVAVTPNRGDCLSVLGIAREVAALSGKPIKRARIPVRERGEPAAAAVRVRIEEPVGCRRYAARLVRNVRVQRSPLWLQMRLHAAGLRSINNVVDVTNLVMIERGQPLHGFDFDRLARPEIVVRLAGASVLLRTLDGVDRRLESDDLLITTGEEPIALAGVMGGEGSEVTESTRNVLLEAAWFDPATVRRTARRLELRSEAAYRFERSVDVAGVTVALDRAAALLRQLAGGEVAPGIVEAYPAPFVPAPIRLRPKRAGELLGLPLGRGEVSAVLKTLGASVGAGSQGTLTVVPPSFRSDLTREIDLIEEIARLTGYDRIPETLPAVRLGGEPLPERLRWMRELKRVLVALGLSEAISPSFTAPRSNELFPGVGTRGGRAVLLNPLSQEESELPQSLLAGLMTVWRFNCNQGATGVALFSSGKAFWLEDGPREGWRLAGVLAGDLPRLGLGEARPAGFADVKGIVEAILDRLRVLDQVRWERATPAEEVWRGARSFHPGKTALVRRGEDLLGVLGALHPDVESELGIEGALWLFELDMEKVLSYFRPRQVFRSLPRFPSVVRDLAIVVATDFASDRVVQFVRAWNRDLIEEVSLFDEYAGAPIPSGQKSLAYSISYRAADRTLTDDEVNAVHGKLIEALRRELAVELR